MPDLLEISATISPHAVWLREHDLIVREYQHPHSLNGDKRFVCANVAQTRYVCGDSEEEAEQRYCELFGLTWWKLADWNAAMSVADFVPREYPDCEEEAP
jgi:hypothetical protein